MKYIDKEMDVHNEFFSSLNFGAQRRSLVHTVVLYPGGGAQRSSHKPRQADGPQVMHMSPLCKVHRWAQK